MAKTKSLHSKALASYQALRVARIAQINAYRVSAGLEPKSYKGSPMSTITRDLYAFTATVNA